jgi:hypothetical protein
MFDSHRRIPMNMRLDGALDEKITATYTGKNAVQPVEHFFWHAGHSGVEVAVGTAGKLRL